MIPRLAIVAGPMKGTVVSLSDERLSIGRDTTNELCLKNTSVSRRHCLIQQEANRFRLTDLGSSNGTFVNGIPVKEYWLTDGDRIRLGDSLLLFCLDVDQETPVSDPVTLEWEGVTGETVEMPVDSVLQAETLLSSKPPIERLARQMRTMVEVTGAINSIRSVEALGRQLVESIFEVVPADRVAVLLVAQDGEEIRSTYGEDRTSGAKGPVEVSRTIVRHVLEKGVALLSNEVLARGDFHVAASLTKSQVRAVLAVPLVAFRKTLGVIYLDSSTERARFDEGHLQLLTAIASMAAIALENARHMEWLGSENRRLQADMDFEHNMVGESDAMNKVREFIAKVAPTDATTLICGESGTGKELVARAIHRNSPRADKPFVAINCAALADTLLESELFGHEKGAFTGASARKSGKLEVADGGTAFLDEIGELAAPLQAKLLRALQEHEFERVGGIRPISVDVRVISSTNRDLREEIKSGGFREDLYYRLNVVSLVMPPLRDRRDDIPLLAGYFAEKSASKCKRRVSGFSDEARACLMNYDWPGNVRELENTIERAVVLGSTEMIGLEDMPEALLEADTVTGGPITKYHEAVLEAKKELILKAFREAKGSHLQAARLIDVHPNYLHRLVRNLNLREILKTLKA